jgi:hypothetical protein
MTKNKTRSLIDYLPFFILTGYTVILFWTVSTTDYWFTYEHYIGLALLAATLVLFMLRHKLGVLSLGLTLILGLFTIASYSAIITYHSIGGSINGYSSGDIKIQVMFIWWLTLHFILSRRHYIGILTKKYWRDLFSGEKPQGA